MRPEYLNPVVIWRLTDGKPGHENQSLGLIKSLQRSMHCQCYDIPVDGRWQALLYLFSATWPAGRGLPLPDLIIGAGHSTHLHMIAAKKVYGGKTIVLMKPSLPVSLFDLSLIPEHDNYRGGGNVFETRGVLNPLHAEGEHHTEQGLIMIGGPSRHCDWDQTDLLLQIDRLLEQNPDINYTLTTSRRTPDGFVAALEEKPRPNLHIVPFAQTGDGWVAEQLAASGSAWITEDSVSMLYEALTARVAVGMLNMPVKRENRVSRGMRTLVEKGMVVRFDALGTYQKTLHPVAGFIEADRCADWIMHKWLAPAPAFAIESAIQHG
jgi:mitochondrial fission protein ELM1